MGVGNFGGLEAFFKDNLSLSSEPKQPELEMPLTLGEARFIFRLLKAEYDRLNTPAIELAKKYKLPIEKEFPEFSVVERLWYKFYYRTARASGSQMQPRHALEKGKLKNLDKGKSQEELWEEFLTENGL